MLRQILHKSGYSLLVLWGVVSLVFFLFNILPGDPASMMVGQRSDLATVETIREEMGFNEPVIKQYLRYLNDLSPLSFHNKDADSSFFYLSPVKYPVHKILFSFGNGVSMVLKPPYLGLSFQNNRPVGKMVGEALPNSLLLALIAISFAFVVGNFLGILAALKKDSWFDRLGLLFSTIGMALPSFFAAILLGWFFAYKLGDLTHLNLTGNLYEIDDLGRGMRLELKNLILPAFTLGIRPLSVVMQLSRNSMLDVLGQDYIRTARAKGLKQGRVIMKHAFRNSLAPVVTAVSGWFAGMLAGVVFVEYIFGWKGLGYLIVNALNYFDTPVVLGCVIMISIVFVLVNFLVDIIYKILDPRLRN